MRPASRGKRSRWSWLHQSPGCRTDGFQGYTRLAQRPASSSLLRLSFDGKASSQSQRSVLRNPRNRFSGTSCESAGVAKLADAPDLGSGGAILRGSSPLPGTLPVERERSPVCEARHDKWTQQSHPHHACFRSTKECRAEKVKGEGGCRPSFAPGPNSRAGLAKKSLPAQCSAAGGASLRKPPRPARRGSVAADPHQQRGDGPQQGRSGDEQQRCQPANETADEWFHATRKGRFRAARGCAGDRCREREGCATSVRPKAGQVASSSALSVGKLLAEDACEFTETHHRVLLLKQALPFHGVVHE